MDLGPRAGPRLVQGVGIGFIFVPLNTVALATIPRERMGNATVLLNVVRNLGGAIGVALLTTLLARRSQTHQATLVGHVDAWDPETAERLRAWAAHFAAQDADSFTAERRAVGVLYQEVTRQAQRLAFADDFWLLFLLFCGSRVLLPIAEPGAHRAGHVAGGGRRRPGGCARRLTRRPCYSSTHDRAAHGG